MKRFLILFFLSQSLFAQNSTLFELSKPGDSHKSYLFGTIHMTNDKVFNFNDSLYICMDASEKVFFEIDLEKDDLSKEALQSQAMKFLPALDSSRIKSFFQDELFPGIQKKIPPKKMAARINNDLIPAVSRAIPLFLEQKGSRSMMMDQYLTQYAHARGKEVIGIEAVDEQIGAIMGGVRFSNDFFSKKTADKIIRYLKKGDFEKPMMNYLNGQKNVMETYHRFAISEIDTMLKASMSSRVYDRIIVKRNDIMFERTINAMNAGPVFVAVGTGHLVGENGLLNQYKSAGFQIREVDVVSPFQRAESWYTFENSTLSLKIPASATNIYLEAENDTLFTAADQAKDGQIFTPKGLFTLQIIHSEAATEPENSVDSVQYADISSLIDPSEDMEIIGEEQDSGPAIANPAKGEKTYFSEVLKRIDYEGFLESAISDFKPDSEVETQTNTLEINGEEIEYSDMNLFGNRSIEFTIHKGSDSYLIKLAGDSGALDIFDWQGMVKGIEFK